MHSLAVLFNEEPYHAWDDVLHSVRTGQPAFERRYGMGPFEYRTQHPESDRVFNEAMINRTQQVAKAVVAAYESSRSARLLMSRVAMGHCWRPSYRASHPRGGFCSTNPT